jgi:hypothetical protein
MIVATLRVNEARRGNTPDHFVNCPGQHLPANVSPELHAGSHWVRRLIEFRMGCQLFL